jgi:hypothetical protein
MQSTVAIYENYELALNAVIELKRSSYIVEYTSPIGSQIVTILGPHFCDSGKGYDDFLKGKYLLLVHGVGQEANEILEILKKHAEHTNSTICPAFNSHYFICEGSEYRINHYY